MHIRELKYHRLFTISSYRDLSQRREKDFLKQEKWRRSKKFKEECCYCCFSFKLLPDLSRSLSFSSKQSRFSFLKSKSEYQFAYAAARSRRTGCCCPLSTAILTRDVSTYVRTYVCLPVRPSIYVSLSCWPKSPSFSLF